VGRVEGGDVHNVVRGVARLHRRRVNLLSYTEPVRERERERERERHFSIIYSNDSMYHSLPVMNPALEKSVFNTTWSPYISPHEVCKHFSNVLRRVCKPFSDVSS